MKKDEKVSDEQLNAFTDGELEADEESRLFQLAEECSELDGRMCQQRKLKELVQHAYRDVPQARRRDEGGRRPFGLFGLAAAAVLTLAVGVAAGWFASRAVTDGPGRLEAANGVAPIDQQAWLLHVATSDPVRMERALARADELLHGADAVPGRRVEIVANEGGLDLLRSDVTPFGDRIRELAAQDVLFFACSRAIQRLEQEGIQVQLVPEAISDYSALDRVALRLRQGWTYEKI